MNNACATGYGLRLNLAVTPVMQWKWKCYALMPLMTHAMT